MDSTATSITAAFIALADAISTIKDLPNPKQHPFRDSLAAVSAGIVQGKPLLDLSYQEDFLASVDMNVVMTGSGRFVEIQGAGEEASFSDRQLVAMLKLARRGVTELTQIQRKSLGKQWPIR